jgi:hypothetical protein
VQVREPAPEKKGQGLEGWPEQRWTDGGGALTERGGEARGRGSAPTTRRHVCGSADSGGGGTPEMRKKALLRTN